MLLICCPSCGERAQTEFSYGGDGRRKRPVDPPAETDTAWVDYVYLRDNPRGAHQELWQHVAGCRQWFLVTRDTLTHRIGETKPLVAAGDQSA